MTYQVLARKWRPQQFDDVVGQAHVLQPLTFQLSSGHLHSAILFTGTRGVGKTTLARLFAKSLNCDTNGVSANPCNTCSSCTDIQEGRFPDLIEVDAASRTRVEDTLELLENANYLPSRGRYKIYLIDEVHMLSTSSFNALLKTLEEPPPHVKFILATTDPQKLPITVLSRCLQFSLRIIPQPLIAERMQSILTQEAISFDELAVDRIAQAARGSMRDALTLLDQGIAFGQGKVELNTVTEMLGTVSHNLLAEMFTALIRQEVDTLFSKLALAESRSLNFDTVLVDMLEVVQSTAVLQFDRSPVSPILVQLGKECVTALRNVSSEDLQIWYQIILQARKDQPYAPTPFLGFQMTWIRLLAFKPTIIERSALDWDEATKAQSIALQQESNAKQSNETVGQGVGLPVDSLTTDNGTSNAEDPAEVNVVAIGTANVTEGDVDTAVESIEHTDAQTQTQSTTVVDEIKVTNQDVVSPPWDVAEPELEVVADSDQSPSDSDESTNSSESSVDSVVDELKPERSADDACASLSDSEISTDKEIQDELQVQEGVTDIEPTSADAVIDEPIQAASETSNPEIVEVQEEAEEKTPEPEVVKKPKLKIRLPVNGKIDYSALEMQLPDAAVKAPVSNSSQSTFAEADKAEVVAFNEPSSSSRPVAGDEVGNSSSKTGMVFDLSDQPEFAPPTRTKATSSPSSNDAEIYREKVEVGVQDGKHKLVEPAEMVPQEAVAVHDLVVSNDPEKKVPVEPVQRVDAATTAPAQSNSSNNSDSVSMELTKENWTAISVGLPVPGFAQSLAANCAFSEYDALNKKLNLILSAEVDTLHTDMAEKAILRALSLLYGADIQLEITVATAEERADKALQTPAEVVQQQQEKNQSDALEGLRNDPNIKQIQSEFGVSLDPNQVKVLPKTNEG